MNKLSRREFSLLAANIGMATFTAAAFGAPTIANAGETAVRLGHFSSVDQQNYARITGSMPKAMGDEADISYVGVTAGPQVLTAIASNALDLSMIGSNPMIVGFATGVPLTMISIQKIVKRSEALIVHPNSGIKTIADVKGKRIGLPFNTTVHFALLAGMKSVGLSASDVTLINLRPDGIAAAWENGSLDATYIWSPLTDILQKTGGRLVYSGVDLVEQGTFIFDAIVVRDGFKKDHPDLVVAYLKELDRINRVYREEPEVMAEAISTAMQIPKETAIAYTKGIQLLTPAEMLTDAWMGTPGARDTGVLRMIGQQAEFLKEQGQVTAIPEDFSIFVDSSFLIQLN